MADDLERSRMRRALRLSKLGARVALKQGRRLLARDESAAHAALARAVVEELGRLKGLPMKIGQILSYMDGVVPEEHAAIYREILGELRTTSEPMDAAACREVLVEELGRPPEEVFDRFDPVPMASASIGQVHAAALDGVELCVKVQYPGIAEATEHDLENLDALIGVMRRMMPTVDTRQMIEDFRLRLAEECDYVSEASYQRRFAEIYRDDPDLCVAEVVDALSTRRVLTTHRVGGRSLEAFVDDATPAQRDRAGGALFRFAFGTLVRHGLFHADPHPGNLLFDADERGRLCVLDFGCVQPIDDAARADIARLLAAAIEGRPLAAPARVALGIAEMDDATEQALTRIVERVLEPIVAPQPYRFTRGFATEIGRATIEAKQALATRYLTRRGGFVADREGVMFVVRNLFGLASIWGTLEARADYQELARAMVEGAGDDAPGTTELAH